MALTEFEKNMDIIAALDDEPNDVGGLSAAELKAKFDEGGKALQDYINNTLLPALDNAGVERSVLLPLLNAGFKYMRLNSDKVLEVSTDSETWQATGSSGHLIYNKNGKQLPQRSRLKFANGEVTDDGTYTIVQGEPGPAYTAGENISISGSVIATKAFPCNPNLLDNGNFQVWQRYPEGTYTGVPDMTYIADRWMFQSSDGRVTNTITKAGDYGIKNASGPNMRVHQRLENAAQYNGRLLTLSVLKGDGSLSYHTVVASGWTETKDIFSVFAPDVAWLYTGDTWLAAKLELGSQQTLAHQENGVWVLNEIPNYGEQLRRCQRYLRPAGYNFIVSKNSAGNWYGTSTFGNSEPMRAVPVIINGDYKAQPIRQVTGSPCATITNVYAPNIYGQFTVQLSPLESTIPNFVTIDPSGFNPLLSAEL